MKFTPLRFVALAAFWLAALTLAASAQDFQQTYQLGPEGVVNIRAVSGNVTVLGYDGEVIVVTATKKGRDRDLVTIEDNSTSNRVEVRDRYPERCNCHVSVNFEVKVPRRINYRFDSFSSVSGDVEVSNVTGELRAKSVSGSVVIKGAVGNVTANSVSGNVEVGEVAGTVNAKSTSGNVQVEIVRLESAGNMDFGSVSGNVTVRVPGNLDADVEMSALSGDLRSDFPIQIEKKEYGPGRSARGRLGNGSRHVKMSSISGNLSLLKM
ncbi:MAG: DUF4097 family beta strand repeat protein [Acidobacteria bacterium]|nr:DUF4097 family beta strand repeat protein [Acidobacteriota bacterium]MBI3425803.1 DUF4097 family beta strand repeat protein [Acidobacteriota bacterium]